jgi:beta-1,4-mannosyltransferase
MSFYLRGRIAGRDRLMNEAIQAVQYLEALGHERPVLLAYNPVARLNPFTATLYSRLWDYGIAPLPVWRFPDVDVLTPLLAAGTRVALHMHWTLEVLREAETEAEAKDLAGAFVGELDKFLDAGGRLAWTVHNVLPHDCAFPRIEAGVQQAVSDRARMIHVMSRGTAEAVAEWFTIEPDKTVHVPHPNYLGAYPDYIPRDQARYDLGLLPDEVVYALVGAIQPYKGLEQLLDAFDRLCDHDNRPRRLLVAGKASEDPRTQDLLDRCQLHPYVVLRPVAVPDVEMQYYLRAADVAVLPYQRSLNSGVLLLALSFGLPLVAPHNPATEEVVTQEVARIFRPGEPGALAEAMIAADELLTPVARAEAVRIARRYDPNELAERFASAVAGRLTADWPMPAA